MSGTFGQPRVSDRARGPAEYRWGIIAATVLALIWVTMPGRQLPLYDGMGFPDEPYRWVVPPIGARKTEPPSQAIAQATVSSGVNADLVAQSDEQGPQVQVWVQHGDLVLPAQAKDMTVRGVAIPPVTPPAGAQLCSNVYRVSIATSAGSAKIGPKHDAVALMLRAALKTCTSPLLERHSSNGWAPLPTDRAGQDVWGALLTQFGDYALIGPGGAGTDPITGSRASNAPGSDSTTTRLLLLGSGAMLLFLAASILAIRRTRRIRQP